MKRSQAQQLRRLLMSYVESLDDENAAEYPLFIDPWAPDVSYDAGKRVVFDGTVYKVLQAHTSQASWTPADAPSLFARVLVQTDENGNQTAISEWEQPDSTNPYMMGDKVTYNGKTYESTIDNNVWAPDVYGWVEA